MYKTIWSKKNSRKDFEEYVYKKERVTFMLKFSMFKNLYWAFFETVIWIKVERLEKCASIHFYSLWSWFFIKYTSFQFAHEYKSACRVFGRSFQALFDNDIEKWTQ